MQAFQVQNFSVSSLAHGAVGFGHRALMAFFCYLDCSGSSTDKNRKKAISVGGYISPEKKWAEFSVIWQYVLQRYGIRELSMSQFAQSVGEFKKWKDDPQQRRDFMVSIGDVVNNSLMQVIGATLVLEAYDDVNKLVQLSETLGSPYAVAALSAFASVFDWHNRYRINEPLLTFYEKGDNTQHELRKTFDRWTWDDDLIHKPDFKPKRWQDREGTMHYLYPFQACDFIAYEQAKAATNLLKGNNQGRKSLVRTQLRDPLMWKMIRGHELLRLARRLGVPKR
jgi:hypothetical protein